MDNLYLILFALLLLAIIQQILRRRRIAAIRHILNQKMQNKENGVMKEKREEKGHRIGLNTNNSAEIKEAAASLYACGGLAQKEGFEPSRAF